MTARRHLALVPVAAAIAALASLPAFAGARPQGPVRVAESKDHFFRTPCRFSHRASDDPIVFPGQPGKSHSHDFFGNSSTNAASTYASLRAAGTVCARVADTAGYWVPTLYDGGVPVQPTKAAIYYRAAQRDRGKVRAFPAGLRMIAGDSRATGAQSTAVTNWHCGVDSGVKPQSTVPTCPEGRELVLRVRFPGCWDGHSLDSADHRSHMAYGTRAGCPRTHPVAVPTIAFNAHYPIRGGSGVTLASGGANTAHADFFNAWDQGVLESLVRRCINGSAASEQAPCKPERRRTRRMRQAP